MILIKHIEYYEVREDIAEIASLPPQQPIESINDRDERGVIPTDMIQAETVRGLRFRRPTDGMDIVVGVSNQAAKVIGLQYEAWEGMQRTISELTALCERLKRDVPATRKAVTRTLESIRMIDLDII